MGKKKLMEMGQEAKERPTETNVVDQKSMPYFTREDFELTQRIKTTMIMQKTDTSLGNIFGLEMSKKDLSLSVIKSSNFTKLFTEIEHYKGFLLFGQTETGKSMIAEVITSKYPATKLFSITIEDLLRPRVKGESERIFKNIFTSAQREKPSVIFIDNIECLALSSSNMEIDHVRSIRAIFCQEMSSLQLGVFVICSTNQPLHDSKVLKCVDKFIHVSLPDARDRFRMFKERFTGEHFELFTNEELLELAKLTRGFSGGDIDKVYRKAINQSFKRQRTSRPMINIKDVWELVWATGWDVKSNILAFETFSKKIRAHNGYRLREYPTFTRLTPEEMAEFLADCLKKYNMT